MNAHVEHPEDHTEREVLPFPIGFVDPAEQILSDWEVELLNAPPKRRPPIEARLDRWRMYHQIDSEGNLHWMAYQPSRGEKAIDQGLFLIVLDEHEGTAVRSHAVHSQSWGETFSMLRSAQEAAL